MPFSVASFVSRHALLFIALSLSRCGATSQHHPRRLSNLLTLEILSIGIAY